MELDTTGWTLTSGVSLVRTLVDSYQGIASGQVVAPPSSEKGILHPFPATVGLEYTVSAWVKGPAGRSLTVRFQEDSGAKADIATHSEVLSGAWQRLQVSGVATQATMRLRVDTGADESGFTFFVDGGQAELGSYATSYLDGSLGAGYGWTGAPHASASTRDAGRLEVEAAWFDAGAGGLVAFLRPSWGAGDAGEHVVLHRQAAPGDALLLTFDAGTWRLTSERGGVAASVEAPASHTAGDDLVIAAGWTPTSLLLETGAVRVSGPRAGGPPDLRAARRVDLGRRQDGAAGWFDGAVGPVLFFDGPPSAERVEVLRRLPRAPRWSDSL